MAKNSSLTAAKKAKNDEFYTQISDIEKELIHYWDKLKGKIIFCNCDDPAESNFWRYFHLNFERIGLKKLIATHYDPARPTYKLEYEGGDDSDWTKGALTPLKGNGDFRSPECVELLQSCDVVVTNPPFSLFREYVAQLVQYGKKFLIIGNKNAVTYKEIFPLIKNNDLWIGYRNMNSDFWLKVPAGRPFEKLIDIEGQKGVPVKHIMACWYTNMDHKKRHESMPLFRRYYDDPSAYPKYDNYDAINVDKVPDIPEDYFEHIGVPVTFLDKYCPDQFEIVDYSGGCAGSMQNVAASGTYEKGGPQFYLSVGLTDRERERVQSSQDIQSTCHTPHKVEITRLSDGVCMILSQTGVDLKSLAKQYSCDGFTYCNGVMGVPITFLDRFCPDQFEIIWIASGHFKSTCPVDIAVFLGYSDLTSDAGTKGYGIVAGHQMHHRLFIRKLF